MFKKSYLLLFTLAFITAINASAQKIEWGNTNKAIAAEYNPLVIGESEDGIYTAYILNGNYYIEKHDATGKRQFRRTVKLQKINKRSVFLEYITYMGGKLLVYGSTYDNSESMLYVYEYDSELGTMVGVPQQVFTVPVEKGSRRGAFHFFSSKDGSKLLINHYAYYKKEERYKDRYRLFDSEANLLVERDQIIERNSANYRTFNYIINNDGTFFFVKSYGKGESYVVSYDANNDYEKWEERIDLSDANRNETIEDIKFSINEQNDLILTGFAYKYNERNAYLPKKLKGMLYLKIDGKTKEIKSQLMYYNELFDDHTDFSIASTAIHFMPDGSPLVVAETFSSEQVYSGYRIRLNDLLVFKFTKEGTIAWTQIVPKVQGTSFVSASL
jgi:hypothetical protein